MLTTYYAAGKIPFEMLFPFGDLETLEKELDLEIRTDTAVEKVSTSDRTVLLKNGERIAYDRLLIATGASAFAPRFEGLDPADAYYMRTIEDAVKLKETLDAKEYRTALVVGASMVGIKVVELLNNRGVETTLADMAPKIFPLAAYDDVAEEMSSAIAGPTFCDCMIPISGLS